MIDTNQIRAKLVAKGSSFRQFAIAYGYEPRTVTQTVQRWAGQPGLPRGRLSYSILQNLSREIGEEVLPGILDDPQAAQVTAPPAQ